MRRSLGVPTLRVHIFTAIAMHGVPAAGLRNNNATLVNASSNGYYWSSSPHGGNPERGGNLNFNNNGNVNPQNNNNRANGMSVRCVSEVTRKKSNLFYAYLYLWRLFLFSEANAFFRID